MEAWLQSSITWLLAMLALPGVGLPAIFLVSSVSATLLPLGSEPALFGYLKLAPHMFWPAILVATMGNTLGGAINYFLGRGAHDAWRAWRLRREAVSGNAALAAPPRPQPVRPGRWNRYLHACLDRFGPSSMLLSWLPVVGDPLCALAGWRRFPFWPSVAYMALGKFARYVLMTAALLWAFPNP